MSNIEVKQIIDITKLALEYNYKSNKYYVGAVFTTNHNEEIVIKARLKDKPTYFLIMFSNGFYTVAYMSNINRGSILSPYTKTVCKVGYLGVGDAVCNELREGTLHDTQEYIAWKGIIYRCYSLVSLSKNPTYKKCSVDNAWLCYQNFWRDIKQIQGYQEWKTNRGKYQLDKDIKQQGKDFKIYSKDTCMFVTEQENKSESAKRGSTTGDIYIFKRVYDGYTYVTEEQSDFADKIKVSRSLVNLMFKDPSMVCKGWKFLIVDNTAPITNKQIILQNIYYKNVYTGIRLIDNYCEEFTNQRTFAKKYNINYKNVNKCLKGYAKTHKGWKFITREEIIIE